MQPDCSARTLRAPPARGMARTKPSMAGLGQSMFFIWNPGRSWLRCGHMQAAAGGRRRHACPRAFISIPTYAAGGYSVRISCCQEITKPCDCICGVLRRTAWAAVLPPQGGCGARHQVELQHWSSAGIPQAPIHLGQATRRVYSSNFNVPPECGREGRRSGGTGATSRLLPRGTATFRGRPQGALQPAAAFRSA